MVEDQYESWLAWPGMDPALLAELEEIRGSGEEILDRFYRDLSFGTGGLRGILGAGTNRMNEYTVARASRGLARWLMRECPRPSCAVAYDSRRKSREFARVTAAVLSQAGVRVWLFPKLTPTPVLSFAVRYLNCRGGVVITASHNPAEYNGYKVYGADGCQIVDEAAGEISACIVAQPCLAGLPTFEAQAEAGGILSIGREVEEAYLSQVLSLCTRRPQARLRLVYSPLNGAGGGPVSEVLSRLAYADVAVVPEQSRPDGDFPTCPCPNPEEPQAMKLAARLAQKSSADLFLATDPDGDRVGVGVSWDGGCRLLTGNEVGILLFDYLCRRRLEAKAMPQRPVAVTTIVTTPLAGRIAARYGVELREVLTGFKYIGQQIGVLEKAGEEDRFLFGFEESCGYLAGTFVRDKDAVSTAALICEMAAGCKEEGMTLLQALERLYRRHGYCASRLLSHGFPGAEGVKRMQEILERLRRRPPRRMGALSILEKTDYLSAGTGLPPSDVLSFELPEGCRMTIRPSGTEPKLKCYLSCLSAGREEAEARLRNLEEAFLQLLER